ncbi:prefoldin domain-containing protein [Pinibacter soli]|nr:prefoldin domain-containing protein [Pinibacter soli]
MITHVESEVKNILKGPPSDSALDQIRKLKKIKIEASPVGIAKGRLLDNHMLNYRATYISRIEGVYDYSDIIQQNINYTTKVHAVKDLPFNVSVFGRYTNSAYFRNYVDFNIGLNGKEVAGLAKDKYQQNAQKAYQAEQQMLQLYVDDKLAKLNSLSDEFKKRDNPECLNKYIHYKEILANKQVYIDKIKDGEDSISAAVEYVSKFDSIQHSMDVLQRLTDSLKNEYNNAAVEIRKLQKADINDLKGQEELLRKYAPYLKKMHVDTSFVDEYRNKFWEGFQKLSLGRSIATSTQLSFQNVSINGVNMEYDLGDAFLSVQAGWTDFGLRDFVFNTSKKKVNNFVYSTGIGIGLRTKNYAMISVFGGKHNPVYSGSQSGSAAPGSIGMSLSGQLSYRHLTLNGEVAQSTYAKPVANGTKNSFSINDKSNKAFSCSFYSILPKRGLNVNGYYKYYGANFYGFNAYRLSANNSQWGVQASKSFFHNLLTINAGIKKNDYQNPYVEQVYNGKNTVTTLMATFRKNRWIVSAGYMPSFQYVSIHDTVYENRYQVLNCMASYSYKVGDVPATSTLIFNRFMNNSASGYFYGNSSNIVMTQHFQFDRYSSGLTASVIKNNIYSYVVFDGHIQYMISRKVTVKGGFKINSLSAAEYESKTGGYGSTALTIPRVGVLSLQVDCNYYPDINYKLYNNTMGVLSFTTYFK